MLSLFRLFQKKMFGEQKENPFLTPILVDIYNKLTGNHNDKLHPMVSQPICKSLQGHS